MKNVLILDTETTGLDPEVDVAIEIACILYSVEHATPLRSYSSLMRAGVNPAFPINGIPVEALRAAATPDIVWTKVESIALDADAIVAHRADFDRAFVSRELRDRRPWICSKFDLAWPRSTRVGESLVPLALAHGLGVASAHRAMADCDMLARLLSRVSEMGVELGPFLERGLRPKALFAVADRGFSAARNELAKAAGFRWDAPSKRWLREMPPEDVGALPFVVERANA